ncbi:MAG: 4Fe-4S binding protein [Candidatus Omnitrophota bacterium]
MRRKIIKIDEEKCNGCGLCVPDCPEGAIRIVEGKARLVKESLCDGLGACLGTRPEGAITIEERTLKVMMRLLLWKISYSKEAMR